MWALLVTPARDQDRVAGQWLLAAARRWLPRVREVIADSGFSKRFVRRVLRWKVTITAKAADGFRVQPRRWVVERTFAWLGRFRRLVRDYERLAATLAGWHWVAAVILLLQRLATLAESS